ncbi:DUF89 family protein [Candidatus Bathyarchaeota archaeon]|nr:DUF89 family protein [Candidatus Bathyarchaeota archaeon]
MKVGYQCALCLVHRAYNQILRATEDRERRFRALSEVIEMLGREFTPEAVPSLLGTKRDRMIRRITGNPDPYYELKRRANREALAMLSLVEALIEVQPTPLERFRMACKAASLGNIIEYDIPGHSALVEDPLRRLEGEEFYIDDTEAFFDWADRGVRVLYLTDNAGEIAFDRLLVRELRRLGCWVTVAVKGGPALNDALMEDALQVGMGDIASEVVTTGADAIGVNPEECSEEFLERFYGSHLILSKGMANWETLTEFGTPTPTLFLLRVKCEPVAENLGAPLGCNVAKLVPKGFRL